MKKYLGIILGIGFVHRFLFLGGRQLWTDELMQARVIKSASPGEILSRLRGGMDLASPLDFLVQRGVTALLGDAAWALRLHALIFGTLSIWIFYRISRFLFGERVALYSATLFAFYPLAYRYSLEGRPYALLLFLSLLSYDLLLRQVYGKEPTWRGWLLISGVSTLLLYTSFLGSLILFAQVISLALVAFSKPRPGTESGENMLSFEGAEKRQLRIYGLAALSALALFYPWTRYVWARPQLSPASEIAHPKLILTLIKGLGDNSYAVAGVLLIGALVGIWALLDQGHRHSLVWLLTWFVVPIPILLLAEVWAGYFFNIRHLLHTTPPILLLAGYGLSHIGERFIATSHLPRRFSSAALAYAGLLICMSVWIGQLRARSEPVDWIGTADFLNETVGQGDAVSMPGVNALLEYYHPKLDAYRVDDLDAGRGSLAAAEIKRRIVVCYEELWPNPCGTFRNSALKDPAWTNRQFKGFTVFIREK